MPLFREFTQNLKNPSEKESSTAHFFSYPPSLPLAICLYSCYPFIIYFFMEVAYESFNTY